MNDLPDASRNPSDGPRSRRVLVWLVDMATLAWVLAAIVFGSLGAFAFCVIKLELNQHNAAIWTLVYALLGVCVLIYLLPAWRDGVRRKYQKQDRAKGAP